MKAGAAVGVAGGLGLLALLIRAFAKGGRRTLARQGPGGMGAMPVPGMLGAMMLPQGEAMEVAARALVGVSRGSSDLAALRAEAGVKAAPTPSGALRKATVAPTAPLPTPSTVNPPPKPFYVPNAGKT